MNESPGASVHIRKPHFSLSLLFLAVCERAKLLLLFSFTSCPSLHPIAALHPPLSLHPFHWSAGSQKRDIRIRKKCSEIRELIERGIIGHPSLSSPFTLSPLLSLHSNHILR
jgi:hypothetical protein